MRPQRGTAVLGAEHPALLEQRDDPVDEVVQAAGGEMRYEDESVGGVGGDELGQLLRDRPGAADEGL